MSRHVETVQRLYAAFGAGDLAGVLAGLSPDVEWEYGWHGRSLPWYQPRRGREAVMGFFVALADFEFLRFEPQAFLAGGDMVVVPIEIELRVRANDAVIRDLEAHLWTFGPDGLVTRMRHLCDTLQFAEKTGT